MKSRIIFGIVAIGYLIAAFLLDGSETTLRMAVFLIMPWACIWHSDAMGEFTSGFGGPTKTTPGCFVAFGGWLLLSLPAIIALIAVLTGSS